MFVCLFAIVSSFLLELRNKGYFLKPPAAMVAQWLAHLPENPVASGLKCSRGDDILKT